MMRIVRFLVNNFHWILRIVVFGMLLSLIFIVGVELAAILGAIYIIAFMTDATTEELGFARNYMAIFSLLVVVVCVLAVPDKGGSKAYYAVVAEVAPVIFIALLIEMNQIGKKVNRRSFFPFLMVIVYLIIAEYYSLKGVNQLNPREFVGFNITVAGLIGATLLLVGLADPPTDVVNVSAR